jgi:hypothetical protein
VVSRRACSHGAWSRSRRESETPPKRGLSDGYGMNVTERLSVAGAQQASTRRSTAQVPGRSRIRCHSIASYSSALG